jgi:hypothetical protein
MAETAADRLLAWAQADAPGPADPLDRPVIAENPECLRHLHALLDPARRGTRRLSHPLAVPPRLLPPG